jgi:lysophospholipase L1-like esterase
LKKILAIIMLPVLILIGMECCARILLSLRDDLRRPAVRAVIQETTPSPQLGWERPPNFEGRLSYDFGRPVRKYDSRGFQSYDTAQIADKTVPRIVAIGDSNTFGWGVPPEAAFAEVLDRSLPNAHVINLGMLGYSSYQGYQTLLKYGEELKPAAIIASFNYNDRRYVLNKNVDSEEKFATYTDGMRRASGYGLIEKIRMARLMRTVMRKAGLVAAEPAIDMDVRSLEARVPPEKYRENLRKIAEYGRARRIPVIFLLLKDNPAYTAQIRAGIQYQENGQGKRAVRELTHGLTNTITGTLARKYLVEMYEKQGATDIASAISHVEGFAAMDGAYPVYLDSDYHRIMTEVSREFALTTVDARPLLDQHVEWFIDACHPDETGHARIAELLLDAVARVAPALTGPTAKDDEHSGGAAPEAP